ncbi:MAG: hypothetical protein LBH01_08480 [Verrucomicrobiales bacterium]|nr:hypothetical protein [Verrucomicrobiales bacterium]
MRKTPLVMLLLSLSLASFLPAAETDWETPDKPNNYLDKGSFRWWAPADAKKLRGVLVIIPGRNGDARDSVNDADWQTLAGNVQFAIVGCRLFKDPAGDYQGDPDGSTAKVINQAVNALAAANGHEELKDPPLAFWGHSAGANTAERYANYFPKRVISVVCIKGTWGPGGWDNAKKEIPWLLCIGKNDKPDWVKAALDNYNIGQKNRADWVLALNPKEGHEAGKTKPLALAFLEETINLRLDDSDSFAATPKIRRLPANSDWLGDPATLNTAPANSFTGKRATATWLPGESTAKAWAEYLKE